jgi:hypothetical protein
MSGEAQAASLPEGATLAPIIDKAVNMASQIKLYKVKDFVRQTPTGEIDYDRSLEIIHELATAASFFADHNVLVDMRETTIVGVEGMGAVLQLALEMAAYKSVFKGKVANVVPNDEERLAVARQFRASLQLQGFSYEVFTNFEDAIDWLSEVTVLGKSGG